MLKLGFRFIVMAGLCSAFYCLGCSQAEIKIVKEQVEVIKYVDRKRAEIHARPNVSRDELLKLMRAGQL